MSQKTTTALRIDSVRFERDFRRLAEIGSTGDGGVHRPALGPAHLEAREWFRRRILDDGLEVVEDGAANLGARLAGESTDAPTVLLGSHLDSVPQGGRFDGALGTLAAYEVLRTVRDAGLRLPLHLEAIDFTDEEGTLVGLLGSRALAGTLPAGELLQPRGGRAALESAMARAGIDDASIAAARRDPSTIAGFLELHIEQGPRLTDGGNAIGIVDGIVGMGSFEAVFRGRADHAGTTPIASRKDAGLAAASFLVTATAEVGEKFPGCVVNFGQLAFEPGAFNIVPATARLATEYRAPDSAGMQALGRRLIELAGLAARRCGVEVQIEDRGQIPPVPCSPVVRNAFVSSAEALGLSHVSLGSGAGHDTMAMAAICPAGMIFVPSTGGSHSPSEHAEWTACVGGANVLLGATLRLVAARSAR